MQQRSLWWLVFIGLVIAAAVYIVVPGTGISFNLGTLTVKRDFVVSEGLDLKGGLRVLLEADVPAGTSPDAKSMETARQIVEQRVNGLGVAEPLIQLQGNTRIVIELPGVTDPRAAIDTIKQTGLMEFIVVPSGQNPPPEGAVVATYCPVVTQVDCGNPQLAAAPVDASQPATATVPYVTLMTGAALSNAAVGAGQVGSPVIDFQLTSDGSRVFGDFTSKHIGDFVAIVLDKRVISAPRINAAITDRGQISGNFTTQSANQLALQLRYGSLPVPLKVVQSLEVGPTLGQDSVRKSTIAGIIGLASVALFMILYYRLPGLSAVLALALYAVLTFALFKLIPVTLTLPGIAGFVLSVGVAVDANILIFERMKEELRGGRGLRSAVEAGFSRAWPSIRDSNISTLITCSILFWFGNTFGASIVKGFAVTLALGVAVSLFTAILVTRTIMHAVMDRVDFSSRQSWFGI